MRRLDHIPSIRQIIRILLYFLNFALLIIYVKHSCALCFWDCQRTLKAGKLNEKILNMFVATGKEEILSVIEALNIQHILLPVLPTRCSEKF